MSGPVRYTPLVFGASLNPSGTMTVFGSKAQTGTPNYSNDPQDIQSPQWLLGMLGSLATGQAPYYQDDNGFRFVVTQFIAYVMQRGIPEWDYNTTMGLSDTTYDQGDLVRRGPDSGGPHITVYQCQTDGTQSDPLTDSTNWQVWFSTFVGPNVVKAWVNFDGTNVTAGNCNVLAGFNVTTVGKVATGQYQINFASPLPADGSNNGLYTFAGSAGVQNGASSIAGDNNNIAGAGPLGTVGVRTANACVVFCWEPDAGGVAQAEDSKCISVIFFG